MENTTLYELNEYVRRVVALNFTEPVWVSCEISQAKNSRGNIYLDLLDKDETTDKTKAQASGIIWYKSYLFIQKKLGELLPAILTEGRQVLIKVKVDFHEIYGMKLVIEDIDPSYTIGHMEMQRQKVVERLKKEELIQLNKETYLSSVIQRVLVISSETAAGYIDFVQQLQSNEYGYDVNLTLINVAVQGVKMESEITAALADAESNHGDYDCIVIIRGGGSKMDLSGFDNYNISAQIARSSIPVFTGIGHEIDDTIADLVSYRALKTPTAVASYIIDRNLLYESNITELGSRIERFSKMVIDEQKSNLEYLHHSLMNIPQNILLRKENELNQINSLIRVEVNRTYEKINNNLLYAERLIKVSDPEYNLKKGYVLIRKNNELIKDFNKIKVGEDVEILGYSQILRVTVNDKKNKNGK